MISISRIILPRLLFLAVFLYWLTPLNAYAQSALSLSISPTLFDMSADPGQEWSSDLKVINTNPYELIVSAEAVNFAASGEGGQGTFVPVLTNETKGSSFAEWITIPNEAIVIPPEQTVQIPFTIKVPKEAPPGGHYAAILIGTKTNKDRTGETKVETAQAVSSLVFLTVSGDIQEQGSIREFTTEKYVYESPEVKFNLRFENKGNVNLQPQGDIKILNMWGAERGIIPVNKRSLFGQVVRESIRKYSFTWSGEWSLSDIGRYTAIATLAYGEDARQFASSKTHFWIIPWKALLLVILVLVTFIWLFSWLLKLYVRRMLLLAGVSPELQSLKKHKHKVTRRVSIVAPIEAGMLDLRTRLTNNSNLSGRLNGLYHYVVQYRLFFIAIIIIIAFLVLVGVFIQSASTSERAYDVTIEGQEVDLELNSEQIKYNDLLENVEAQSSVIQKDFPAIRIINRSSISGLAARLRYDLMINGYPVSDLNNELATNENKTVIVYAPDYAKQALELSNFMGETLLSSFAEATDSDFPITIYVGSDLDDKIN